MTPVAIALTVTFGIIIFLPAGRPYRRAAAHLTTSYYAKHVGVLKGELEWFRRGPEIIKRERRKV